METPNLLNYIVRNIQTLAAQSTSDSAAGVPRVYPLVNHTALIHLTPDDFIRPGDSGWVISTIPMFIVLLNLSAFVIWIIIVLYVWKLVYYQVSDPYATSSGSSPPNFQKRIQTHRSLVETVYDSLALFSED